MKWIYYALASAICIGVYNAFLEGSKNILPKGIQYIHMYLCSILIMSGIISALILVYYNFTKPKDLKYLFDKSLKPPYFHIIVPAIILCFYMFSNILAISKGGGVAVGIINLSLFVSMALGVALFGDKINSKVIISAIIAGLAMSFAAYESSKIR